MTVGRPALRRSLSTAILCLGHEALAQAPAYTLPPDKLAKAQALGHVRILAHFGDALLVPAVLALLLLTGTAARIEARIVARQPRRVFQGVQYFALLLATVLLAELPLQALAHAFSLHYGISVQSWSGWFMDVAKSLALSIVIGTPVLLFFHWIVRRSPRRYWVWGWAAAVALVVFGASVEPLAEPLFNHYEPLGKTDPALVGKLEAVVQRTGTRIPPEHMFLMKASAKTNGLNAYVSGLGPTRRVVIWDTTAGRIPDSEILFTFGHESGHDVLHHIPKMLTLGAAILLPIFWLGSLAIDGLLRRFGPRWGVSSLASRASFVLILLLASSISFLLEPLTSASGRFIEHEADIYGQEAIHGLVPDPSATAVASFQDLGEAWLEDPGENPFVVFWMYDHPAIAQRATFARGYNPWANGGRGQFFAH